MMFQYLFTSTLLVTVVQLSATITPASGLHLYSQSRDIQPFLPSKRTVFNPNITSPTKAMVWKVGDQVDVMWDVHDIPKEKCDQESMVVLGWIEPGSSDEHLDLDNPLANGFKLKDGRVRVTVPNVVPKDNYVAVVFGDSGNCSPTFSIKR